MIKAPWTKEQVENLNFYQQSGVWHPFTCGNSCGSDLVAAENGWMCPKCAYTQDWAHPFMFDRSAVEEQLNFIRGIGDH